MATTLRIEIFPTDIDACVDFWVRVLGFELVGDRRHEPDRYVAMVRDDARVGALEVAEGRDEWRRPPTGTEIVLEVDDVRAELRRIESTGWPVAEGLELKGWGLWDFRVLDPSGYYVRLTHRPEPS